VDFGPAFSLFGRYLATRIDMLPAALCEDLGRIPDAAPPLTTGTTREIFMAEMRRPPELAFRTFQPEPFESRILWQAHRATLGSSPVVVKIMRPGLRTSLVRDDLEEVARILAAYGASASQVAGAAEDFRTELAASMTFEAELEAAFLLARDAQTLDVLGAPAPVTHLCGRRLAVFELEWTVAGRAPDPNLARTLCVAWLRQALQGAIYPVDPRIENIVVSSDNRVVFAAGPFAVLPQGAKVHLWDYLIAVAAEEADDAYEHLSRETTAGRDGAVDDELRRCLRQTVAFRDGIVRNVFSSGNRFASEHRFSDEVLLHWRFASERGPIAPGLVSFYRGVFTLVDTARLLAPDRDSLAEALTDLRLMATFSQMRDMLRPSEIAGLIEAYTTVFLSTPQQLDRLLAHTPPPDLRKQTASSGTALVSLLLALGAVAMLFHKISQSANGAPVDRVLMILFGGIGFVLLWIGSKLA
jgi:hypothetical protein